MGVSDLSVLLHTTAAAATTADKGTMAVSPTWRLMDGSLKKSKSEKKKLKLLVVGPKDRHWQHAMVSKLYPAMLKVQRPLSPQPISPRDVASNDDLSCVATISTTSAAEIALKWLVNEAARAFEAQVTALVANGTSEFHITSEGCGGAYFLHSGDAKKSIGIFKPRDEEYMAPANPRGYVQEHAVVGVTDHPVNKGFRVGNGALRERAAYLLDAAYGHFSGVPVTTLMELPVNGVTKEGSMQAFVESECSAEDMGTLKFSIPEVHKVGILDVRLFNTDRHAGNILLQPRSNDQAYTMTPIDHGFCLPSYQHLDNAVFDWLHWPQAQFPFTSAELELIESLDVARDAAMLRGLGIEEECVTTMRMTTSLLKIGADAGFSLFEIASHLQREGDFSTPSAFEEVVAQAIEVVQDKLGLSEEQHGLAFHDALVAEVESAALALFADQPKKKVRSISCFSASHNMGRTTQEDKVSIIKSDSLQKQRSLKLEIQRPATSVQDEEEDNDEERLLAPNLYLDSPRVGRVDEDLSDEEIARRKQVGLATVAGLFLSIMICFFFLKYLSHHESFSALPPTQLRFMSLTTAAGAKENLEQYTAGTRHTGGAGDYEMAKYIRSRAIDFGIDETFIKLEEFEILVNEPEQLKLEVRSADSSAEDAITPVSFDFMAAFKAYKASKKNSRIQFPPFHLYSKNGSATGPLVYAHYGTSRDYHALKKAGVNITGSVVLVRVGTAGDISLAAKVVLAGRAGAAGVLTYHDPIDDGVSRGKSFPDGPWRSSDEAAFGSVYMGNGDPSTPDGFSSSSIDRISVDEVFSVNNTYNILARIPSMPISARVASTLLKALQSDAAGKDASTVFSHWRGGGLDSTYKVGDQRRIVIRVDNKNKYSLKKVWNVLITIKGTREGDRYVIVGAQRDALNAGAVLPGSGNAVFLEMLRAVGDLLTNGWVPHRTILLASFDGEQFGSVGSSEWIDRHFTHLGGRGIIYLNLRDVVRGSGALHCEAAATLRKSIYLRTTDVAQPKIDSALAKLVAAKPVRRRRLSNTDDADGSALITGDTWVDGAPATTDAPIDAAILTDTTVAPASSGNADSPSAIEEMEADEEFQASLLPLNTTFGREDLPEDGDSVYSYWLQHTKKSLPVARLPTVDLPGEDNRISPFMARLGIPSVEFRFDGDYFGVEGTANDTIDWMKKFGDPTFSFHRAAAQLYGSVLLSFSDAIFMPYDFTEVARDLRYGKQYLIDALEKAAPSVPLPINRLESSIQVFEKAAVGVTKEIHEMTDEMVNIMNGELVVDLKRVREMNTRLLMTEKAFLLPAGLPHMPWLKHALYGISEWDDYRVGFFPGVAQEIKNGNAVSMKRELIRLCQTIEQAADILSTTVL
ncbi:TPA: hypothetical protein N0F65_005319 [Lagenidium giganteum]|uniref:PI3K/PI4K catalytic domain-containing protein n=1 Tax=Lagenidium giganteum TaxID=4803 RepID=A0AAV2YYD4_9STRA|nr:TPA: hypothetical protein N0F65_005319 [Lagenidium giganteum]